MVISIIKGAPFIRTKNSRILNILTLCEYSDGDVAVDLGSGDGSIVIAFAQNGIEAHGYEINVFLVLWSWLRIRRLKLEDKAFVHWGNMWRVSTRPYSIIVIYGFPSIMKDFEKKLQQELLPGARVISHAFEFPQWISVKSIDSLFLYKK